MNCLNYFKQLCSVPHGSGNIKQVSDLLFSFGKEHGLESVQDEKGNVIIYKAGSIGKEDLEPVILQAHMDMVCVKEDGCNKDMTTEGLDIEEDGNFIWAKGTSLGGDDCIGCAMMMTILADDKLEHTPIEAVFTVDEETDMGGAKALDVTLLKGKRLINLDDELEGEITVSCAGGIRIDTVIPCIREEIKDTDVCYKVEIKGLLGGHSGVEIDKNRANAIRLLARLFFGLSLKMDLKICEFEGGIAPNVIPGKATAVVALPQTSVEDFERLTIKHEMLFKKEYPNETDLSLSFERTDNKDYGVVCKQTKAMCRMLSSVPDGLRKMSEDFKDLPHTSSNLGLASLEQDGLHATMHPRSCEDEARDELVEMILKMVAHDGGHASLQSKYPAWKYRKESSLRDLASKIYYERTGHAPQIHATHGGLETGIFSTKIEDFDCIAIGPNIYDIHSPKERMELGSVDRTYDYLVEILKNLD